MFPRAPANHSVHSSGAAAAAAAAPAHKSVPRASNFSFTNVGLEVGAAQTIWAALRRAILEIQEGNQGKLRFEELYRNAYTLVLHKHGDMLYRGVEECITQRLQGVALQVAQASDTYLLDSLVAAWEDHKLKMTMMKDILMYMDKTHCKQMNLVPVYEKGLLLFRDCVVRAPNISGRFKHIMLDNVRRERDSEQIDPVLLRNSCLMLVEINIQNLDIYQREFETDLLAQTRLFYAKESQLFISENSVPDYLIKIESRLLEEEARADKYFDKSTKPKLRAILQEELLVKYAARLVADPQSGAAHMLTNGMVEDMGRMYSLFCREPTCLDGLRDALSALVKSTGAAIVSDRENLRVPRVFVEKVLECRAHYLRFVEHAFRQDRHFARALRDALEQFINLDTRAAQFLSLYTDDLLRKQVHSAALTDLELDEKLNQVMSIFRYLQDKDIFEDYYKQHLATRLIEHTSSSAETEKLMIAKLKSECGHTLTSRLEGMFRDMDLSKQIMRTWREGDPASQQSGGCELNVSVLTTGFWPLPAIPQCILPREAQLATDQFKRFYISQHSGRKLTWQTSLGQAELRCTFDAGKKELVVHTYQMCILMLFNSGDKLSFAEIQRATAIPADELTRHLLSLAHPQVKLLLKNPPGKACEPSHRFKYNNKYASNLYRNKIAVLSKAAAGVGDHAAGGSESGAASSAAASSSSSSSSSSSALPASIIESRQFSVEASIVRIMKSRKTLEHNALMGEVVHQLQSKFPVEPTFVKKRIEALIEREYLERDPNNRRIYNYKA